MKRSEIPGIVILESDDSVVSKQQQEPDGCNLELESGIPSQEGNLGLDHKIAD